MQVFKRVVMLFVGLFLGHKLGHYEGMDQEALKAYNQHKYAVKEQCIIYRGAFKKENLGEFVLCSTEGFNKAVSGKLK